MRRLVLLTLGFGLGCAVCAYLLTEEEIRLLFGCALVLLILPVLAGKWRLAQGRMLLLLGLCLSAGWFLGYHALYLNQVLEMDSQIKDTTVEITDYSYETDYGTAAQARVTVGGTSYPTKVYLGGKEAYSPGDTLTGPFRFQTTLPGGTRPSAYHRGRGTFLLLYQAGELTAGHEEGASWTEKTAALRKSLKDVLAACFPQDTGPFAKALLLGDTGDLDYETDTSLKVSGIRHVAAVSGLHVSMLFALIGGLTMKRRFLTELVGLPALALFAALAGFTPSVTRACLMFGLMLLSRLLNKNYDSASALAFAALVMLTANPLVITDPGFQLSVASVAGILLFSGRIQKWMMKGVSREAGRRKTLREVVTASVSVSLSAQVFTAPLCALHFGVVSLIGVATNLLTLWAITFLFCGIMGVCLIYVLWCPVAVALAEGLSWGIRYVLAVAKTMARFPLAAVYTRSSYIVCWLAFLYVLLAVFLLQRNKKPKMLTCCAVMGLCAALLCSWVEPMLDEVRFTVLDVGQGQCLLFQSQGYTFLVDCGGEDDGETADTAAETLLSQGITRLDGLILTHCDRDHAGGVEGLLSRVETNLVILPEGENDLKLEGREGVITLRDKLELTFGSGVLRIYPAKYSGTPNEKSLCVLFDTEKCDILITGDRNSAGERALLEAGDLPKVDILVAGHHGSKYSTSQALLTAVQPDIVCISVGKNNPYGHPAPELLTRLAENGCKVCRTDLSGDILIRR